jgi:succinate dehydrogenase / fumarate reductase cytochrome b subunit
MASIETGKARPLSPHLSIYRPIVTMVMSILHRITGVGNFLGMILVTWWLVAVASGEEAYATVNAVLGSWIGLLVLFGFSWSLIHHAFGGLRHLVWDTGRGFDEKSRTAMAWGTIIGSGTFTIVLWIVILTLR